MKRTTFGGISSRMSCGSLQNHSTSASSALLVEVYTWITVILNGLPWKQTEIILLFLRLHPSTAFWTLVDHDGYSISSEGFLPAGVDIRKVMTNLDSILKSRDIYFANKGPSSQGYGFSSGHVWM